MITFLDRSILFFCAIALALVASTVFMLFLAARPTPPGLNGALIATVAVAVVLPLIVSLATRRLAGVGHPVLPWIAFYIACVLIAAAFAIPLLN